MPATRVPPPPQAWYEIKRILAAQGIEPTLDATQMAAYSVITNGTEQYWIGYDTPATHRQKMCYARSRGIGAVMAWDADMDDSMEMMRGIWESREDPCEGFQMPRCR